MIPFDSPAVWRSRGRGLSMGTVAPEGRLVHLTGQVAWDADERLVGPGDVAAQAERAFDNIAALLAVVGGRLSDIVQLTTYHTAPDQLPAIQAVRARRVPHGPASTSVVVAGLGDPGFLVELTPVAVVPADRFRQP